MQSCRAPMTPLERRRARQRGRVPVPAPHQSTLSPSTASRWTSLLTSLHTLMAHVRTLTHNARPPRTLAGHPTSHVLKGALPMADFPAITEGIVLTHFIVSSDVAKSRQFYSDVLGGETLMDGEPTIVALANSWIIINTGGGPTDDKPTVTLAAPTDPDPVSAFLNIRVPDIAPVPADWRARGAQFLPPPIDRGPEIRCYLRDPAT